MHIVIKGNWLSGSQFRVQGYLACGGVAFFILLDIVDEPMNGSSYAQCTTLQYLKTVHFSSVNLEP
jgi:hypothetical protein